MSRSIGLSEAVADYVRAMNRSESPAMARCRSDTAAMGDIARMQISPEQGAVLDFFIRLLGARRAVEVGVFTGYSALATARALKDVSGEAMLHALDISPEYLETAAGYWREEGVEGVIDPRAGPADVSLETLLAEGLGGQVDFIFVDADKTGYPRYFQLGLDLLRPGGVIAFDNVLWSGSVADPAVADADTEALRAVAKQVRDHDGVDPVFTSISDGLLLAMKR